MTSWTRILSYLKDDGHNHGSGSGSWSGNEDSSSRISIKDKFKNFNLAFEEIYKNQRHYGKFQIPSSGKS
jgi:exocyst complex component 7